MGWGNGGIGSLDFGPSRYSRDRSQGTRHDRFPDDGGVHCVATAHLRQKYDSGDDFNQQVKVDCAEFHHSHEIAKLIGSPPGYLGHRETHPLLSQEALNQCHTDRMKLTFVLFDEIEKASDALWNLIEVHMELRRRQRAPAEMKGTLAEGINSVLGFHRWR